MGVTMYVNSYLQEAREERDYWLERAGEAKRRLGDSSETYLSAWTMWSKWCERVEGAERALQAEEDAMVEAAERMQDERVR